MYDLRWVPGLPVEGGDSFLPVGSASGVDDTASPPPDSWPSHRTRRRRWRQGWATPSAPSNRDVLECAVFGLDVFPARHDLCVFGLVALVFFADDAGVNFCAAAANIVNLGVWTSRGTAGPSLALDGRGAGL